MTLLFPMQASRLIDTPSHAARFVSLIPFEKVQVPGGESMDIWHTSHAFLSKGSGDAADHSILLCCLLLGFGMDAYLCVGTSADKPHVWVMTKSILKGNRAITFWESLTGQRYSVDDPRSIKFYQTISCVFNNKRFFGNIQIDEKVSKTNFDLENESCWKSMSEELIAQLPPWNTAFALNSPSVNLKDIEVELEEKLKENIREYRIKKILMTTSWDESLSYILAPALANYEFERITGFTFGNEEFKSVINQIIPEGHTFKAFPLQVNSLDSDIIISNLLQSDIGKEIIDARGDQVRFALRTKIVSYGECSIATWVMLAVKFRTV